MKINGIVLINKERGKSSNSVVNAVKHILKADKAGHFGTLDVLGEGLLPVALGKATKLFDYFLNKDKTYLTTFIFGKTTDTLDLEGEIIEFSDKKISSEDIEKVLPQLVGKINQMPPIYSAKKINGKKAYQLARKGEAVALKPKAVEIYSIKLLHCKGNNTFDFEISCSSGTYIRSICRDMATSLGTYGVMSSIQRTRCGIFNLSDSVTLEGLNSGKVNIIKMEDVIDLPSLSLSEIEAAKVLNGLKISTIKEDGNYKCFTDNKFLGLVETEKGQLKLSLRLCD